MLLEFDCDGKPLYDWKKVKTMVFYNYRSILHVLLAQHLSLSIRLYPVLVELEIAQEQKNDRTQDSPPDVVAVFVVELWKIFKVHAVNTRHERPRQKASCYDRHDIQGVCLALCSDLFIFFH